MNYMTKPEELFAKHDLSAVLQNQEQKVINTIDAFDANRLLNTSMDDLVQYFFEENKVEPITIFPEKVTVDEAEAKIDVSRDSMRFIRDRSRSIYLDGTRVTFFVPHEGDKELFYCRPSTFNFSPPNAVITKSEIQIVFDRLDHDAKAVKSDFDHDYQNLKEYLGWIEKDVKQFNGQLMQRIRQRIEGRKQKILNDRGLVASLGFPLKKRDNAPVTYSVPVSRKKVNFPPSASTQPFSPEPALDLREYPSVTIMMRQLHPII